MKAEIEVSDHVRLICAQFDKNESAEDALELRAVIDFVEWKRCAALCKSLGWRKGINDPGFAAFVKRVAKVENPRFLTSTGIRNVIVGLERWIEHDKRKEQA